MDDKSSQSPLAVQRAVMSTGGPCLPPSYSVPDIYGWALIWQVNGFTLNKSLASANMIQSLLPSQSILFRVGFPSRCL